MNAPDQPRVSKLRFAEDELTPEEIQTGKKYRPKQRKVKPAQTESKSSQAHAAVTNAVGVSPVAKEMFTRERPLLRKPSQKDMELMARKRKEVFKAHPEVRKALKSESTDSFDPSQDQQRTSEEPVKPDQGKFTRKKQNTSEQAKTSTARANAEKTASGKWQGQSACRSRRSKEGRRFKGCDAAVL